jgi:hypothetical protein
MTVPARRPGNPADRDDLAVGVVPVAPVGAGR